MLKLLSLMFLCSALMPLGRARAFDFTPQPLSGGTYRFKDCNGRVFSSSFIQNYSYSNAQVHVSLDSAGQPYLAGSIDATGLKPNFAYQVKLSGRNSKLYTGGDADNDTNERLGLIGRWWRAYPNPANALDADYLAHKDDPNYAYTGYLIIGFFITDENGAASLHLEGDNSFHVLWRTNQRSPFQNDGPVNTFTLPATTGNPAYDFASPALQLGIYGEWEPTRALPGTLSMPDGHYACDFVLTEESFHDSGTNAGNWPAVLGAPVEFDIGAVTQVKWSAPADIVYPTPLSATQLNATADEPGTFAYSPPLGTVLDAGTHTLTVLFTPASTGAAEGPRKVTLTVKQGTPEIAWNPPRVLRAFKPLTRDILNAKSDTPGTFAYDPPLGASLAAGKQRLTLQFIPGDLANYELPPRILIDVEAVAGLLIVSGPLAQPNPAYAGSPVQFTAATEAGGLLWTWDFGDGSPPGNASVAAHAYAAAGTYTATLVAQVKDGRAETQTVQITVLPLAPEFASAPGGGDADNDGFTNALELAWGSDPGAADSTPLGSANGLTPEALHVKTLGARLWQTPAGVETAQGKFAPGGRYRIDLRATFTVPKNFDAAYARLGLSLCGLARAVTLDDSGGAKMDGARIVLKANPVRGDARTAFLDARLEGTYIVPPAELAEPYASGAPRTETVMVVLGGKVCAGTAQLKLKRNKSVIVFGLR